MFRGRQNEGDTGLGDTRMTGDTQMTNDTQMSNDSQAEVSLLFNDQKQFYDNMIVRRTS